MWLYILAFFGVVFILCVVFAFIIWLAWKIKDVVDISRNQEPREAELENFRRVLSNISDEVLISFFWIFKDDFYFDETETKDLMKDEMKRRHLPTRHRPWKKLK